MTEPWASLKHQSRTRPMSADEMQLATALEALFAAGIHDFEEVARRLSDQQVVAPASRATTWTTDLLVRELDLVNASLDDAYAARGLGA